MEDRKRILTGKTCSLITVFTFLMLWVNVSTVYAQKVTLDEAKSKANAFFTKTIKKSAARKIPRKAPQMVIANDCEEFYIFNDEANTGYVIISGDERTPDVLAYSESGHYDSENVPCNMQMVLDIYAEQIAYLQSHPDYKMSAVNSADETKIAPLLGKTAWAQDSPYNNMCPTIDGKHCLTGCVATATAQIMYYHKWPERGKGSHSYEWKGQTLSADFSQSEYRWDLMTPTYNSNSSQESCDAVALLMRDVGYAQEMYYSLDGSSPSLWIEKGLVNYFDYDESIAMLSRDYCDSISWHKFIIEDLSNGQPVLYSAQPQSGGSGHALVIDGYDGDGYFHFNFGWGPYNNGNYTMLNIPTFNSSQEISFGIKKNSGGKKRGIFGSNVDFLYVPETNTLECKFLPMFSVFDNNYQTALAIENTVTHEIIYTNIENKEKGRRSVQIQLNETLADGDYILYLVARKNEEDQWQHVLFHDLRQTFVDLHVENGNKTYSNNHIYDYISDGVICIDNIYYRLDDTKHEATVVSKNDKYNSYSGEVTIPAAISYKDQEYSVTGIDTKAFYESKNLTSITIPNSITSIKDEAFAYSGIKSVVIPNSVKNMGSNVFACCNNLVNAVIPDSWETIPWGTFSDCRLKEISIPNRIITIEGCAFDRNPLVSVTIPPSIKTIGNYVFKDCSSLTTVTLPKSIVSIGLATFSWCRQLKDIYLDQTDPNAYHCAEDAFSYNVPTETCTLHVPVGSKDAYASTVPWSKFQNILEDESLGIGDVRYDPNGGKHADIYTVNGVKVNTKDMKTLPKGVYIQGKKKVVKK